MPASTPPSVECELPKTVVGSTRTEHPIHPEVYEGRTDLVWCNRCGCYHRDDYVHGFTMDFLPEHHP